MRLQNGQNMLLVSEIRKNIDEFAAGLEKRGIQDPTIQLNDVVVLDDSRKSIQTELDNLLSESNTISKSIGNLMKDGKMEEANAAKPKYYS